MREHMYRQIFKKPVTYATCSVAQRITSVQHQSAQILLTNLSNNTTRKKREDSRGWKRRLRPPRTNFGCTVCRIPFCTASRCWNEHLAKLNSID